MYLSMASYNMTHHHLRKDNHYNDAIMSGMASQITSLTIVYSIFFSDADQRQQQSSASLAFVWGINRWPLNALHKGPVTRKMFPFHDVIKTICLCFREQSHQLYHYTAMQCYQINLVGLFCHAYPLDNYFTYYQKWQWHCHAADVP